MKYLAPIPKQFVDHNGLPLSDGKVHVYISGDTQYANVYQDADGNELMPNPARLDSNGAWLGFVTAGIPLDYVVEDKDGNVQFEYERVVAAQGGSGSQVAIEPIITSGTKIAECWVDGELLELFAPDGSPTVSITPTLSSGTKIADYSINGVAGELYAPNGGGSSKKRVGFVNTNGNITHTVTGGEISSGYCFETKEIAFAEMNSNPFTAVFISFNDFWEKSKYSSIDIYATYEWVGAEYEIHLFKIDGTAISNNYFKDFEVFGQVSLPANKYLKLKIKWNLNGNASVGDNLLIKGNIMVASTQLLQSL